MTGKPTDIEYSGSGPKVLEKALRVLDLFTAESPAWSLVEIAEELRLPSATTHRIVRALAEREYLMRTESGYRLGLAAIDLGHRGQLSLDLRWRLRSVLRRLAGRVEETALLTVRDDARNGSMCIDRIESARSLRLSIDIGRVTPIHAGASGKALLAFSNEHIRADVLSQPLVEVGPATITDPAELEKELAKIRRRGWAVSYEENDIGAWGAAAPILSNDLVIASIGFAAPIAGYRERETDKMAQFAVDAAREAEALLSQRGQEAV